LTSRPTHLIFATSFSDACHAAIPAVSRIVDTLGARLTILHVYDPRKRTFRETESTLNSFYAEADNYPNCERQMISGSAFEGITEFCKLQKDALLFLPASDRIGLPRIFHRSLRARIIHELPSSVWTLKQTHRVGTSTGAFKHIAVWLNSPEEGIDHVCQAADHANRLGATLHLIHIVPDANEGMLGSTLLSERPLGTGSANHWLAEVAHTLPNADAVKTHVRMGNRKIQMARVLRDVQAELLMVSRQGALQDDFFQTGLSTIVEDCSSALVCVPQRPEMSAAWAS
jgi:nucleotide-binding universal stress UspA family protein